MHPAGRPAPYPEDLPNRSYVAALLYRARETPDTLSIRQVSEDLSAVDLELSYSQLLQAVDAYAAWLVSELGLERCRARPLAHIGERDVRYLILPLAAMRIGGFVQSLSVRNSSVDNKLLLATSKADVCLYSGDNAMDEVPMEAVSKRLKVPDLSELLRQGTVDLGSSAVALEAVESAVAVVLQSSGTTGHPKAINVRMDAVSSAVPRIYLLKIPGSVPIEHTMMRASNIFSGLPIFHAAGFLSTFGFTLYYGMAVTVAPRTGIIDEKATKQLIQCFGVDACFFAPVVVERLAQTADPDILKALKYIVTSGAPVAPEACKQLSKTVPVIPRYASTETYHSIVQYTLCDGCDPAWLHLPSTQNSIHWEHHCDDLYEMVLVRDEKLIDLLGVFKNLPELSEFRTSDLFRAHPTIKDHYQCVGRNDDIIVFSNASKIHPQTVEAVVGQGKNVKHVILVGNNRPHAIAIVEPLVQPENEKQLDRFSEEVWERIQVSNTMVFNFGRLERREWILIAAPDKPLPLNAKGAVNRLEALRLYETEIDELYKSLQ